MIEAPNIRVVDIPGRGRVVYVDGDLYLSEDVVKEFARFALLAVGGLFVVVITLVIVLAVTA